YFNLYTLGRERAMLFPDYYFFAERRLVNHTIETRKVKNLDDCELLCYLNDNCVSLNFKKDPGIISNSFPSHICELNNATHLKHDSDLTNDAFFYYRGSKNSCDRFSLCQNNATCLSGFTIKGYRCLCPPGFDGEHCENVFCFVHTHFDECETYPGLCHVNATCVNTRGSYVCTCKPRYTGDGRNCTDTVNSLVTQMQDHANIIELFLELCMRYVGINSLIPTLTACLAPLGMDNKSKVIKDAQISASSEWDGNHAAIQGRLNFLAHQRKKGGWSAKNNNLNQWIQVDLLTKTTVTHMATQGRNADNQWVKKYRIQYSDDGVNFSFYQTPGQNFPKEFIANQDSNTVVLQQIHPSMKARYIRLLPTKWHNHISMRMELYGCKGTIGKSLKNYKILNENDRKNSYSTPTNGPESCDDQLPTESDPAEWYRLMGDAGTKMPTKRVDAYHCSTIWSGWLDGTHPTMEDGEVYRKICFSD
ncbi:unnamed protein product, partial [Pocillopora meandrina]